MRKHIKFSNRATERMIKPTYGNISSLLTKFGLYTIHLLGRRAKRHHAKFLSQVSGYFTNCLVNEGTATMINKMKVSVLSIEKYLAGQPLTDTRPLGAWVSLRNGLPAYIPREMRSSIRARSVTYLRFIISVLSMYRGLASNYGLPNYESISAPKSERNFRDLHEWFDRFVRIEKIVPKGYIRIFGMRAASIDFMPIFTSSPNHSVSYGGILRDAQLWKALGARKLMWEYLDSIKHLDDSVSRVLNSFLLLSEYRNVSYERSLPLPVNKHRKEKGETSKRPHGLGRISLKYEAAGKIRPFAIVDYWTQIVLKPLHSTIMSMLTDCFSPMDATFDQFEAVSSFAKEGHKDIYSFDLSKATDMIPVQVYEAILSVLVTKRMARAWVSLMTARHFLTSEKGQVTGDVQYTRGQPMGAYSSWAMLALFHHLMVQYSAFRVSEKMSLFTSYRVLGDDIVIGDRLVASEYLKVAEEFGIPISLHKSFVSETKEKKGKYTDPLFNFANQIWLGTTNISPLPFSEYLQASAQGLSAVKEIAFRLIRYGWVSTMGSRMRLLTWNATEWQRVRGYFNAKGDIKDPFVLKLLSYAYQPGSDLFLYEKKPSTEVVKVPSCGRLLSTLKNRKVASLKGSVVVDEVGIGDLASSLGNKLAGNLSHLKAKTLLWTQEFARMNFCVNLSKELIPARGWVGYKNDISDLTAQLDTFYDIQSDVWTTIMLPARVRAAGPMNLVLNNWMALKDTPYRVEALDALLELNRSSNPPKKLETLKDVDALVSGQIKIKSFTPMAWRTG